MNLFLCFYAFADKSTNFNFTPQIQQSIKEHMELLHEFKNMYINKHFDKYLFDTKDGYLQTSLSNDNKMSLNYFVEYNNMWWFPIIYKVIVPAIGYDYENNTGFIVLDIYYDNNHILRGTQYIKFHGDKIVYLRTYGSPTFFSEKNPLIKLDSYGNQIWLATGYDLDYSAKAALLFFDSPIGRSFSTNSVTKEAVKKIELNLKNYLHSH